MLEWLLGGIIAGDPHSGSQLSDRGCYDPVWTDHHLTPSNAHSSPNSRKLAPGAEHGSGLLVWPTCGMWVLRVGGSSSIDVGYTLPTKRDHTRYDFKAKSNLK